MKKPPVVAILGHIDHGKTSLLSKIREQDLTKKESGGITQHIGAYQIKHQGQKITFIDTPGHVAFSRMRARGAQVTDLVVLVIAADDGIMPQTRESLEHIRAAKTPFLVAINKVDLAAANPQKVKEQLQKEGILVEDLAGDVVSIEVSAKTGQGIPELLELIILSAEMQEKKVDPGASLKAVVIESSLDSRRGPVASLLVQDGTLRLGDGLRAGQVKGKVKAMFNENNQKITAAGPSQPVEVLGFKEIPTVGSLVSKATGPAAVSEGVFPVNKDQLRPDQPLTEKKLKIILKADVQGTLEAVQSSLPAEIEIISQSVGSVTESDVLLAAATVAEIFGFRIKVPVSVAKLAQTEGVKIRNFSIIYELLDEIKKRLIEPEISEEILGRAEILAEFEYHQARVAGCRLKEGKIRKSDLVRLRRGKETIGETRIKSMKYKKDDIDLAKEGQECGLIFKTNLDFQVGDSVLSVVFQKNESKS